MQLEIQIEYPCGGCRACNSGAHRKCALPKAPATRVV